MFDYNTISPITSLVHYYMVDEEFEMSLTDMPYYDNTRIHCMIICQDTQIHKYIYITEKSIGYKSVKYKSLYKYNNVNQHAM